MVKAPRNRTIVLEDNDSDLKNKLLTPSKKLSVKSVENKIINQNLFKAIDYLPKNFIDLLFLDPPYNLDKKFNEISFKAMEQKKYEEYVDSWLSKLIPSLKDDASIYFCCDWKTSSAAYNVLSKFFYIQNRITWEREKGRGAKNNWKNCSEDIWFCTKSKNFKFNLDSVKLKRKVLAPYRNNDGEPKDWIKGDDHNFRVTHPSNLWTDITIPFWSMPENTDHPTQKPEKLLAKIILSSTEEGDLIFDPFGGSGSTAVTAKKLNRKFCSVEIDEYYCLLTLKRLKLAEKNKEIQGYDGEVFWERNSLSFQKKK